MYRIELHVPLQKRAQKLERKAQRRAKVGASAATFELGDEAADWVR